MTPTETDFFGLRAEYKIIDKFCRSTGSRVVYRFGTSHFPDNRNLNKWIKNKTFNRIEFNMNEIFVDCIVHFNGMFLPQSPVCHQADELEKAIKESRKKENRKRMQKPKSKQPKVPVEIRRARYEDMVAKGIIQHRP